MASAMASKPLELYLSEKQKPHSLNDRDSCDMLDSSNSCAKPKVTFLDRKYDVGEDLCSKKEQTAGLTHSNHPSKFVKRVFGIDVLCLDGMQLPCFLEK